MLKNQITDNPKPTSPDNSAPAGTNAQCETEEVKVKSLPKTRFIEISQAERSASKHSHEAEVTSTFKALSKVSIQGALKMAESPAKRARRTDSAAMWDTNESTVAPTAHKSSEDSRDSKHKATERASLNDAKDTRRADERRDDRRRRSRSRDRYSGRRERSRSRDRAPKDRERDRNRDRARDYPRDRDRDRDDVNRGSRRQRERSQSPGRTRSSKDIRLDRDRDRPRHRSRSRSPVRNGTSTPTRTRSPPKAPRSDRDRPSTSAAPRSKETPPTSKVKAEPAREDTMQIDSKANGHTGAEEDENSEDALLRKMMGFSAFKSTQNQKIPGNNVYGVRKEKSTKYRQYMNRTGGFNRPLSPSRD